MNTINIDELIPGMFVENLPNASSFMVVQSGLIKSFNEINNLRRLGVTSLNINPEQSRLELFALPSFSVVKQRQGANQEFIDYKVGSLVTLTDGFLAVVSDVTKTPKLKLECLVFYDINNRKHIKLKRNSIYEPSTKINDVVNPNEFSEELNQFLGNVFE